jgi:GNAT superfamily N-acetyltransferase
MLRIAVPADAPALNALRLRVRENMLSRPDWLTEERTVEALTRTGRGWLWEEGDRVLGFSVANAAERNIWALFVEPGFEGRGIGRVLLDEAVQWLWRQGSEPIWLSTEPGTRAEAFYRAAGWTDLGLTAKGEIRFELHGGGSRNDQTV